MKRYAFYVLLTQISFTAQSAEMNHLALEKWLARNSSYRLALNTDCGCEELILKYEPEQMRENLYLVQGDFDGDGTSDLAAVVVKKETKDDSLILVFSSRFSSQTQNPLLYETPFSDRTVVNNILERKEYAGRTLLLYGAFASEAEAIDIPFELP